MADRIRVDQLRERAAAALADPFIDVLREGPFVKQTAAAVLALLDAVEAAHELVEDEDTIGLVQLMRPLRDALARFDFGDGGQA